MSVNQANSCVNITAEDGALWVELNRPDSMNAIDEEMLDGLNLAIDEIERSSHYYALVLTGRGRAFCAGVDLGKVLDQTSGDWAGISALLRKVGASFNRLASLPVPVIAAVNGIAVAGGLELVLCCDLVVATRSARLGDAHANYGLVPGAGSSVRLTRRVGVNRAKQMLFTGDPASAQEMFEAGLVNQIAEEGQLLVQTRRLLERLAGKSRSSLRLMKALVDDSMDLPLEAALRAELLAFEAHSHSPDLLEGLRAFREKRPPRFNGPK